MIVSTERRIGRHMGCDRYKMSHVAHATAVAPEMRELIAWRQDSQSDSINGNFSWVMCPRT